MRLKPQILVIVALAFLAAGGSGPWVKLAWLFGGDRLVLALTDEEAVRGAAFYRLGRYEEADAAYAAVGRKATYNRAATLALTGKYELAAAYYDAILFADRDDEDARFNRSVVDEYYEPVTGESDGHGRIAVMVAEAGDDPLSDVEIAYGLLLPDERRVRKPVDARSLVASREWLETLTDAPGIWLKARLAAEHERRKVAGTLHPVEASPW